MKNDRRGKVKEIAAIALGTVLFLAFAYFGLQASCVAESLRPGIGR